MVKWLPLFESKFKPGTLIGDYQIIRPLGIGSYGITYLADSKRICEKVVIKQLRKHKRKIKKGIDSFQKEKEILSSLSHPSIPRFIEEKKIGKQHVLILEYKKGRTVEEEIFEKGTKYLEKEAFFYLFKVLEIVKYLHEHHIVHRDLRIPNILIDEHQVNIIDFGLARFTYDVEEYRSSYLLEKRLMREIHFRSDFYALGHFVLFLLYSTFTTISVKEKSWEEELDISSYAKHIIRRLLMLAQPYDEIDELIEDVNKLL